MAFKRLAAAAVVLMTMAAVVRLLAVAPARAEAHSIFPLLGFFALIALADKQPTWKEGILMAFE